MAVRLALVGSVAALYLRAMHEPGQQDVREDQARFRRTLAKVMTMQVVALLVLWLLQQHYS